MREGGPDHAVEAAITDLQLGGPATDVRIHQELREEMATLREQIRNAANGAGVPGDRRKNLFNPKDCMPGVLGQNYKQHCI